MLASRWRDRIRQPWPIRFKWDWNWSRDHFLSNEESADLDGWQMTVNNFLIHVHDTKHGYPGKNGSNWMRLYRLLYCCLFLPLLSLFLSETTAEHASATERSRVNHLIMVVFSWESWNQNIYFIKSNKPVNTKQSTNENSRLLRVNCSTGKTREIHACKSWYESYFQIIEENSFLANQSA